jgi:hypothetical protein
MAEARFNTWYEDEPDVVHDVPETPSEDRIHVIGDDCWCNPISVTVPPGRVVKHTSVSA